jgi:hypothetical protein
MRCLKQCVTCYSTNFVILIGSLRSKLTLTGLFAPFELLRHVFGETLSMILSSSAEQFVMLSCKNLHIQTDSSAVLRL